MRLTFTTFIAAFLMAFHSQAQVSPAISSWIINTTNLTGYNCPTCTTPHYGTISANIQSVYYSSTNVYVSASGIPSYNIGPWASNPNTPSNQSKVWMITLNPTSNTGTKTKTGLGVIGVWSNGVGIFNPWDGYYWNNSTSSFSTGTGTWNRNAYIYEAVSFDACLGHPNVTGAYHNHVNPKCLYDASASTAHSPIIGYAFDGFPIYGAYGYTNTDGTGAIKRMTSSYVLTTATTRAAGPTMAQYAAGSFCEDYVYTNGAGDLDAYNGRTCVTPEYPSGTYAYFVTIDAGGTPVYPFVLGPSYYGVVQSGNTGPGGGSNTIPGSATKYTPSVTAITESEASGSAISIFPNPVKDNLFQFQINDNSLDLTVRIMDYQGRVLINRFYSAGSYSQSTSISAPYLGSGMYMVSFETSKGKELKRVVFSDEL